MLRNHSGGAANSERQLRPQPWLPPDLLPWSSACRLSSAQLRLKEQNEDFSCCLLSGRQCGEFELSPNRKLNEHF